MELLERLRRDELEMAKWYPQFHLIRPPQDPPWWTGMLKPFRTLLATFRLAIQYRPQPGSVPFVWLVAPEISKRTHPFHPHLNADGSLCTFFIPDRIYNPLNHDVSRLVDLASDWLRKHLIMERFGWWPGPEAPHDTRGVLAILASEPQAPCICGSGHRFNDCCRTKYEEVARLAVAGRLENPADLANRPLLERITAIARTILDPVVLAKLLPESGPPVELLNHCRRIGSNGTEDVGVDRSVRYNEERESGENGS